MVNIAIIGLGQRGMDLLTQTILKMDDCTVVAVCDEYEDRAEAAKKAVIEAKGNEPFCTTDYREAVALEKVHGVVVSTAWEAHVDVAVAAMQAGKYVGIEVGGAYSVEDCWELVRVSEKTGVHLMLLENCCYTRREMMALNMVKKGVFGEIVHCQGAYHHDIRYEIAFGEENRHYRLRNYLKRNAENYPTHELGPIAKVLDINRGNRMVSLVSIASKAVGLNDYAMRKSHTSDLVKNARFAQGDVITTIIKCAGGETITLTLDTTLPRIYSRSFYVQGTRGYYEEATDAVFLDFAADLEGDIDWGEFDWAHCKNNADEYAKEYEHPLWKKFKNQKIEGGHDGGDWLVMRAFVESVRENKEPPIDVYDAAAWMSITALSEDSVAMGGTPVPIPDFTRGKWLRERKTDQIEDYRLDEIPNI